MSETAPGPVPEGQPAPLNPQARTEINQSLKAAGVSGLDYQAKQDINESLASASADNLTSRFPPPLENPTKKPLKTPKWDWLKDKMVGGLADPKLGKPTNKADVIGGLAINGIDNDPRMDAIKQELSADYNEQAKQIFKERFPEDAEAYDRQAKIYENPNEDPAIQVIEEEIKRAANNDPEVAKARTDYVDTWNNTYKRFSQEAWINFARLYPDKAAAYKDKFPPLQQLTSGLTISPEPSSTPIQPTPTLRPEGSPQSSVEQPKLDLSTLIAADNVKVDDFFGLGKDQLDELYINVSRLAVHNDMKIREKAQKIREIIEMGKEVYLQKNPGTDTINFK